LKPLETILIGGAAVLVYSLFRKGAAAGSLNFLPFGIKDIKFQGVTPVLTMQLAVQNTSNQDFSLNSFAGSLFSNGTYIGNVSTFAEMIIPPNSQTILEVKIRLSILQIVNNIIADIERGTFKEVLTLKAYANVDNLQVPIEVAYKMS
jgi:LEA14-like dessication related protein